MSEHNNTDTTSTTTRMARRAGITVVLLTLFISIAAVSPVAAEVSAADQEVKTGGSTIEVTISDASGGIDPLPNGWEASNPSEGGNVLATGGINWAFNSNEERTVSVALTPPESASVGDSVTLTAYDGSGNDQEFAIEVTEVQNSIFVDDQTVLKQGSSIEVTFNNSVSGGVEDIPTGWTLSEPSEDGSVLSTGGANWDFGETVTNRTVRFDLEPANGVTTGETATITAYDGADNNASFTVTVDEQHESGTSQQKYNAVAKVSGDSDSVDGRSLSTFRRDLIKGNIDTKPEYEGLQFTGRDYSAIRSYLVTGS